VHLFIDDDGDKTTSKEIKVVFGWGKNNFLEK